MSLDLRDADNPIITGKKVTVPNLRYIQDGLTDDEAISFTPTSSDGLIDLGTNQDGDYALALYYNVALANAPTGGLRGATVVVGTGPLSSGPTGGVDGMLNIHNGGDGKIYIKNRRGYLRLVYITLK